MKQDQNFTKLKNENFLVFLLFGGLEGKGQNKKGNTWGAIPIKREIQRRHTCVFVTMKGRFPKEITV